MVKEDILVSAVAVVQNDGAILPAFIGETWEILDRHYANYELLLVDNGSADGTETIVRQFLGRYTGLRYLRLTRETDDETALMAGLDAVIGDYVVTIEPDLDPPAELVSMVETCRAGADLVLGVDRRPPRQGWLYTALRNAFVVLNRRLLHFDMVIGTTGFRVISRQGINALIRVRLRRRYFTVVVAEVGLKTALHAFGRICRSGRPPKRRLLHSLRVGLSVLIHNSITPLRAASALGLAGSLLSLLYSAYVVAVYLFKSDVMPGWTTLSLAMSGLFALAFLMLALMGEYLGRLLEESAHRPLYHVWEELSSAVMLDHANRRNVLEHSEELGQTENTGNGR